MEYFKLCTELHQAFALTIRHAEQLIKPGVTMGLWQYYAHPGSALVSQWCIAFLRQWRGWVCMWVCMCPCRCPFRVPLDVPYLPSEVEIGPQAQPKQAAHATTTAAQQQHANTENDSGPKVSKSVARHSSEKSASLLMSVPT